MGITIRYVIDGHHAGGYAVEAGGIILGWFTDHAEARAYAIDVIRRQPVLVG